MIEMEKETKELIKFAGVIVCIVLFFTFLMTCIFPTDKKELTIDGRIVKVIQEKNFFNVTFDCGNNNFLVKKLSGYSMGLIDGYDGRMSLSLVGYNDGLFYHWDGIYTVVDIVKLDDYR